MPEDTPTPAQAQEIAETLAKVTYHATLNAIAKGMCANVVHAPGEPYGVIIANAEQIELVRALMNELHGKPDVMETMDIATKPTKENLN